MTAPPRTIERLLAGLGAKPDFRNAVLGDLAEEFASRVEADGIESATRWYRREAVRAVPHLLRSWLRGARLGDIGHIAGVIATAYTGMLITFAILGGVIVAVVRALGYRGQIVPSSIVESTAILSCLMLFGLILGAVGRLLGGVARLEGASSYGGGIRCRHPARAVCGATRIRRTDADAVSHVVPHGRAAHGVHRHDPRRHSSRSRVGTRERGDIDPPLGLWT